MMEKILIGVSAFILVVLLGFLVILMGGLIYPATLRYEEIPNVSVEVVDKKYNEPYCTTSMMYVGKTMMPQTHYYDAEYKVYVLYKGEDYYIDDEELFERVNVGDNIYVCVHRGYNKKGEEKHIYLTAE